ncbi:hypothetical protein ABFS82_01G074800 [Erythranthe guttata]
MARFTTGLFLLFALTFALGINTGEIMVEARQIGSPDITNPSSFPVIKKADICESGLGQCTERFNDAKCNHACMEHWPRSVTPPQGSCESSFPGVPTVCVCYHDCEN